MATASPRYCRKSSVLVAQKKGSWYELSAMKTLSEQQFVDYMSDALPELISRILREDTSAVSQGKISLPQFWALHFLAANGQMTVNALAEALNRQKSSTSGLANRLVVAGLVKRTRCMADRRVVYLSLTVKGKRMMSALVQNRKDGIRKTYQLLDDSERAGHKAVLEKVLRSGRTVALLMVAALGLMTIPVQAEQPVAYSLEQSIRIGLKQSIPVANAARQRMIAEATQKRARSEAFPQLTGTADYTMADDINFVQDGTKAVGLDASLQVFAGGRVMAAIRAAKAYKQLTAEQERGIRSAQVRDISMSYFDVLLAQERVATLEQSVAQLAAFEKETRQKYNAGTVSEFEWLSAKVALSNEEPRLIAARNELTLAKEAFRNLTYIDEADFVLSDPLEYTPVKVGLDEAISSGMAQRPELQQKGFAVELRREDINQQKSAYYPRVSLFANYGYSNPDPYAFLAGGASGDEWAGHWTAGIRATWNLFDGGARRADLSESQLNMAIESSELSDLQRTVALEIRTQWLRARDSELVIRATEESVSLARRALYIAKSRYDEGLGTYLEFTQANVELGHARLARAMALQEYMKAVTGMKYAVGTLLEEYEHE